MKTTNNHPAKTTTLHARHENRRWHLQNPTNPDNIIGHVKFLDQIHTLNGTTLTETGGHGATLAPGTIPPTLHAELLAARHENHQLTTALDQARQHWRHLAHNLNQQGLNVSHTANALGISRAAATKLINRAKTETPTHNSPTALMDTAASETQDVAARVEEVRREVDRATARQEEFSSRWRQLAVALQDAGLTNRDVAHLMGVTEARVSQLAPYDSTRAAALNDTESPS